MTLNASFKHSATNNFKYSVIVIKYQKTWIALVLGVEGSNAASGESGPLGKESGVPGGDSGLLVDAELSMGVAGAFLGGGTRMLDAAVVAYKFVSMMMVGGVMMKMCLAIITENAVVVVSLLDGYNQWKSRLACLVREVMLKLLSQTSIGPAKDFKKIEL
nr:hypothetical protein Iba_scaffold26349CG0020 [Ipomoea batatas]